MYQYGAYVLKPDNTISITFTPLNAADYTPLDEAETIVCKIDERAKVFSAT